MTQFYSSFSEIHFQPCPQGVAQWGFIIKQHGSDVAPPRAGGGGRSDHVQGITVYAGSCAGVANIVVGARRRRRAAARPIQAARSSRAGGGWRSNCSARNTHYTVLCRQHLPKLSKHVRLLAKLLFGKFLKLLISFELSNAFNENRVGRFGFGNGHLDDALHRVLRVLDIMEHLNIVTATATATITPFTGGPITVVRILAGLPSGHGKTSSRLAVDRKKWNCLRLNLNELHVLGRDATDHLWSRTH